MSGKSMSSLQRVLTTLGHKEPDRVPLFLLLTMHGAKELGMGIREYYSRGRNVAEGLMRLRARLGNDCVYAFFYARWKTPAVRLRGEWSVLTAVQLPWRAPRTRVLSLQSLCRFSNPHHRSNLIEDALPMPVLTRNAQVATDR